MTQLDVRVNLLDNPWTHLEGRPYIEGVVTHAALLPDWMGEGRSVLALAVDTDDGRVIVARVSLKLARYAARLLAQSTIVEREIE